MEFVEIFLMIAGALLLLLAIYLGREQQDENNPPAADEPAPSFSAESATKLEKSLTEMVHEVHNLSRDMTEDLDQRLSELKELLEFADIKVEELTRANNENRGTATPEDVRITQSSARCIGNPGGRSVRPAFMPNMSRWPSAA